jgi:tripartite-type tricarboxylate transporter receptor subunit TctC
MAYVMGIQLLHVPYKGSSAAFTDLMGQTVDLVMTTSTFAGPFIKAGKARALGVAGAQRMPSLPDVPTFVEQGFQYQIFDWKAVAGPRGIPSDVVAQLSRDLNRVLVEPAVVERIESEGASVIGGTPEHMRQVVLEDVERWKRLVQKANIKIE